MLYVIVSIVDPMYSAGDLWEQLLEKEKEKVKALEDRYAEMMKEKGVCSFYSEYPELQ